MNSLLLDIMYSLIAGLGVGYFIYIWNETHFLKEYAVLLRVQRFFKIKEFEQFEIKTACDQYPVFLRERYNSWFTRLLGCPFCLIAFLSLIISCVISWWASGVIASVAAIDFLVIKVMYHLVYK